MWLTPESELQLSFSQAESEARSSDHRKEIPPKMPPKAING